jgi:hypothetical protein
VGTRDIEKIFQKFGHLSFEDFLKETNAGSKCTACTLDLEYFYVQYTNQNSFTSTGPRVAKIKYSLKQKIYKIIDRFSPMVSSIPVNYIPIIAYQNVDSWVWVANHSILYEGKVFAPDMGVTLIIRDKIGSKLHEEIYSLEKEKYLRVNVSKFLLRANKNEGLTYGSLEVRRSTKEVGFRGTTRPQLEIVSPNGNGVVHTQGRSFCKNGGFSCFYRPNNEKIFISVINLEKNKTLNFSISYPLGSTNMIKDVVSIQPSGTKFYEIKLNKSLHEEYLNKPIDIKWNIEGSKLIYVICASECLDSFSIDHST